VSSNRQPFRQAGFAFALAIIATLGLERPTIAQEPGFTPAPEAPARQATPAAAEDVSTFERPSLIGACRATNRSVEIFADSNLSPVNRIGTFGTRTPVTLTGVLREGRAQVYYRPSSTADIRVVGWVNAAFLTGCDQPPPEQACFRVLPATGLVARETPNGTPQRTPGGSLDGPAGGSQVFATTNPPTRQNAGSYGWMQVRYTSLTNATRTGWVAERLINGGFNLTPCN
jgi:hypothetical protein